MVHGYINQKLNLRFYFAKLHFGFDGQHKNQNKCAGVFYMFAYTLIYLYAKSFFAD